MESFLEQNAKTIACRAAADKAERVMDRIGQRVVNANAGVKWAEGQVILVKKANRGVTYARQEVGNKSLEQAEAEVVAAKEKAHFEEEAWNSAYVRHEELWNIYLETLDAWQKARVEMEPEELDEVYREAREANRDWDKAF